MNVKTSLPLPPFEATGNQTNLVYIADAAAVQAALPPQLEVVSTLGRTPLTVTAVHYERNYSIGSHHEGPRYEELGFAVPVRYTDAAGASQVGLHFLSLHLNAEEPQKIGVETYGFAKTLASIDVRNDHGREEWRVRSTQGELIGAMTLLEGHRLIPRIAGRAASLGVNTIGRLAGPVVVLNDKGGTTTRTEITSHGARVVPLRVVDAQFPILEKAGILSPGQRPVAAFELKDESGELSEPTNI